MSRYLCRFILPPGPFRFQSDSSSKVVMGDRDSGRHRRVEEKKNNNVCARPYTAAFDHNNVLRSVRASFCTPRDFRAISRRRGGGYGKTGIYTHRLTPYYDATLSF